MQPRAVPGYFTPSAQVHRMTDRNPAIVEFYLYLYLAATFVTVRQLIQRACTRYR